VPDLHVIIDLAAAGIDYAQSDTDVSTDLVTKKQPITRPLEK
jgi:hypothetical protein